MGVASLLHIILYEVLTLSEILANFHKDYYELMVQIIKMEFFLYNF